MSTANNGDTVRIHYTGTLTDGKDFVLVVEPLSDQPQQRLKVLSGRLKPSPELPQMEVLEGVMTLHGPVGPVLRGSLDLKVGNAERAATDVIGSFVASVQEGPPPESNGGPKIETKEEGE